MTPMHNKRFPQVGREGRLAATRRTVYYRDRSDVESNAVYVRAFEGICLESSVVRSTNSPFNRYSLVWIRFCDAGLSLVSISMLTVGTIG